MRISLVIILYASIICGCANAGEGDVLTFKHSVDVKTEIISEPNFNLISSSNVNINGVFSTALYGLLKQGKENCCEEHRIEVAPKPTISSIIRAVESNLFLFIGSLLLSKLADQFSNFANSILTYISKKCKYFLATNNPGVSKMLTPGRGLGFVRVNHTGFTVWVENRS